MNTQPLETVPTAWSVDDEEFFRVVGGGFDPAFLFGAGVLLASYDLDDAQSEMPAARPSEAPPTMSDPSVSGRVAARRARRSRVCE
jgi:hypothetical protein